MAIAMGWRPEVANPQPAADKPPANENAQPAPSSKNELQSVGTGKRTAQVVLVCAYIFVSYVFVWPFVLIFVVGLSDTVLRNVRPTNSPPSRQSTSLNPIAPPPGYETAQPGSASPPAKAQFVLTANGARIDLGNGISFELVCIPAGSLQMGSADGMADERPVHTVTIGRSFLMGKLEVTQAQWEAVMGFNPSTFKGGNRPVEQVSWLDCQRFCAALSTRLGRKVRLPTEAEWEYACGAGTTTKYSYGDDASLLGPYAWYSGNSGDETHDVGGKRPNAWGLHDMHGNVWEWCEDANHNDYAGAPADGSAWTNGVARSRVVRGGGWLSGASGCACTYRFNFTPSYRSLYIGFRLVLDGD